MNQNEFYAHRELEKIRLARWKSANAPDRQTVVFPTGYAVHQTTPDNITQGNTTITGETPNKGLDLDDLDSGLELEEDAAPTENTETSNNPNVFLSILPEHATLAHTLLRHLFHIHDNILPHHDNAAILRVIHDRRLSGQQLNSSLGNSSNTPRAEVRNNISIPERLINSLADSFGVFLQHHINTKNPSQPKIHDDLIQDYPEKIKHSQLKGSPNLQDIHPLVKHHVTNLKGYLKSLLKAKDPEEIGFDKYLSKSKSPDVTGLLSSLLKGEK